MEAGRSYLLGTGQPYAKTWNRPYVIFTPACNGRGPVLSFADGFFPHDCGGSCEAAEVLKRPAYLQMLWKLELGWIIAYIERMAAGENLTVDELQQVYYQHTGRQMEVSSDAGEFRFMARPNENGVA
jgi:hypothetical protein